MTGIKRRACAVLLTLSLILSCLPGALAAETAATIQLTKAEGTVSVSNRSGRSISIREDMRIYNGYRLETEEASYAWLNLDRSKFVKLDAVSELEVRKDGKKLELLLNEGNLFFNVTEPLEDDETLNIRVSTMTVGIRGTCGWVRTVDQWTSRICVLEGAVQVSVADPVTGQIKAETIAAGENALCVVYPQDREGDKCDILRDQFSEADVDGFVLTEAVPDGGLCDRIYGDSGLDLRDRAGEAEDRLRQDQAAVEEKLTEIKVQTSQQETASNVSAEPVWAEPVPEPLPVPKPVPVVPPADSGSSNDPQPQPDPPSPPPTPSTVTLTMPVDDDTVDHCLNQTAANSVVLLPGGGRASTGTLLEVDSGITVPDGKSLTLQPGVAMDVQTGQTVRIAGTMTVGGSISGSGAVAPSDSAAVKAMGFSVNIAVGWKASDTADSEGYYSLVKTVTPPTPVIYTITFDSNGGSVDPASMTTDADGKLAFLPVPTRENYTFDGWFTTASATGRKATENDTYSSDTTLYAQWKKDGITWRVAEGTLYIGGSGAMEDYNSNGGPWVNDAVTIEKAVIGEGVTSIGKDAFAGCKSLTSVTIPSSVTGIGTFAFSGCPALTAVNVESGSSYYTSVDGILFNQDKTKLIFYPPGKTNSSYAIPDTVTEIDYLAFGNCKKLTNVTIPLSVRTMGSHVFFGCSGLTEVEIPDSVTSIGNQVFVDCRNLTSAKISAGVTSIGYDMFWGCKNLNSVTIPSGVTSIETGAFDGCNGLTDVYYGGTEQKWQTVTGKDQFDSTKVTIHYLGASGSAGTNVQWECYDGTLRFTGTGKMEEYEGGGYTNKTPWGGKSFTKVVIEEGVTSIGAWAFYQCPNLTSVKIPDSVNLIDACAFTGCTNLTSVSIPDGVDTINANTFMACSSLTSVRIPSSVKLIFFLSFSGCDALTDVYYGGKVDQWKSITIHENGNDALNKATIHCTDADIKPADNP